MKLEGVTVFLAIVDSGSISGAARRLRLSKSVVSERLAELERAVGSSLIQRNSRRIALTEDGRMFRERASRIVAETSDAVEELAQRRGSMVGALSIAAPKAFGDMHLAPALFGYLRAYPEVRLTVDFDDRLVETASGYDAVVRIGPEVPPGRAVHPITTSRRVFVASPGYIGRFGRPRDFVELGEHMAVHFLERSPDDWTAHVARKAVVSRVVPRLRVNSCAAMLAAAVEGIGIASLPTFLVSEAVGHGKLVILDVGTDPDVSPIVLAHDGSGRPTAKVRALVDHLRSAFGDPPYWDLALGDRAVPMRA